MKWPLNTRVEVEWVDSCTNGKWASVDVHRAESRPSLCRSIGYLLERSDKRVVVAQSMSTDTGHVSDTMAIPRVAVKRMRRIVGLS